MNKYRTLTSLAEEALGDFRVVSITGARQAGKTTLVRELCARRGMAYVSLEDAVARSAAQADADGWLGGFRGPLAIDEVQHVPDLFRAIKRRVDANREAGQYLITGSALWLSLKTIGESLAGRVALLELWPFSLAEREEREPFDFARLQDETFEAAALNCELASSTPPGPAWFEEAILRGGFPEPSSYAGARARALWFESYLNTYLQRDVLDLTRIEHADLYVRLIRLLVARTGQILNLSALARDIGLPQPTARRYADWLTTTCQRFDVPPYSANVGKRLVRTPKSYWADTGMAAALLGWRTWKDVQAASADGALVETWVATELRKWLAGGSRRGLHFWRSHGGGEADFILEDGDHVTAIEVKAGHRVDARDLKGLCECREALGKRFRRGIVLYGGAGVLPLGDRLYAVPLAVLRGTAKGKA